MDKITVFYHVWQAPGWELLFQQQVMAMHVSGLLSASDTIYVCCNGHERLPFDHDKFVIRRNQDLASEADTLNAMHQYCVINPDHRILYVHTKGLSRGTAPGRVMVDAWRLYLEYYVIHRWRNCTELLADHDLVGTEWMPGPAVYVAPNKQIYATKNNGIFVGNFWWARADYVNQLDPRFLYVWNAAHQMEGMDTTQLALSDEHKQQVLRFNSELWVGTGSARLHSFNRLHTLFYDTNVLDRLEQIA